LALGWGWLSEAPILDKATQPFLSCLARYALRSASCRAAGPPMRRRTDQVVGLQEGAFVNERPDLPDDLLRRTLGQATTSCACMRKSPSRSAAFGVAVFLSLLQRQSAALDRSRWQVRSSIVSECVASSIKGLSCLRHIVVATWPSHWQFDVCGWLC
jgi:hypothetical protein